MERSLITRGLVILAVIVLAVLSVYPPKEKVPLGLDLRGGMHLVLQVETEDAVRAEADNNIDRLEQELTEAGITGAQVERTGDAAFAVRGVPADREEALRTDVFDTYLAGWDNRREGDQLIFEIKPENVSDIRELAVRQALETIRNRVDAFGVAEPVIHREGIGGNRIVVQLPGVDDPERVKRLIKNTAFLEFRLVAADVGPAESRQQILDFYGGQLPDTFEILPEDQRNENKEVVGQLFWVVEKKRAMTGRDLQNATPTSGDFNEPAVSFTWTSEGGRKFGDLTGANIGRAMAIILDGKVMSAPTIQDRITDSGIIHGRFTVQEVEDLVTTLRSGALPAGLTYLEERTVGPSLGQDSIDKGLNAGLLGGLLVLLTMLIVYKGSGVNAIFALAINIVLIFGALAVFGATLTLPGIAGIVLTIGMAVDANVLIFERIKEELRAGRTVKSSIAAGFEKAFSSILDGNMTTLIAAMFLFLFGTGPIRGFAVTLSVGIIASMFTAIFVSRFLFDLLYTRRQRVESISI